MAVYKVPQDVEADDKLIGPFSFRQFIYLIVVAISMGGAFGLSQLFIPLAIVPLPIIIFFGALALPLRKDQPMEAYLSAVVSFYFLKSRKRFWIPDGIDSFVTIIPPKDADKILTKDLNEDEANQRLGYLANLVDSHGWAIRGDGVAADTSISTDLYFESKQTVDMMDNTTPQAKALDKQLGKNATQQKKDAVTTMKSALKETPTPAVVKDDKTAAASTKQQAAPATDDKVDAASPKKPDLTKEDTPPVSKLPPIDKVNAKREAFAKGQKISDSRDAVSYANALMEQASEERNVPIAKTAPETAPNTSASTPITGTMNLTQKQANELSQQRDVSVQTIAKQASRVAAKNKVLKDGDSVTISFH